MIQILKDKNQWNRFVNDHFSQLEFSHLYEWMEIWQESMGMEIYPLAQVEGGEIKSIFPLVFDPNKQMFYSNPFGSVGGLSDPLDYEAYLKFIDDLAIRRRARGIEVHPPFYLRDTIAFKNYGYNTNLYTTYYLLDLSEYKDFDDVLINGMSPRRRRRSYRTAIKKILISRHKASFEGVQKIYLFYREVLNYHREKYILPEKVFIKISEKFEDYLVIFLAEYDNQIIGGAINFIFHNSVTPWFIVSLPQYRYTGVNNGLFGEIIRWAKENNFDAINWGPALPYSSAAEIKKGFGGEPFSQIRAIKMLNLGDKMKIEIKSVLFNFMNKFPVLWRFYK